MRVLLLGAGGMLARDVVTAAPSGVTLVGRTRAECDITQADAVARAVGEAAPDWVVNAAAYTAVDRAEAERELSLRINGEGPGVIGHAAAAAGARVLHLSTDYVFPGTGDTPWHEDDAPDPVNWYGFTKLAGERALQASGAAHLVVRVQWLYGSGGTSFPRTMLARALDGKATRVVNDQVGSLTATADLARALWSLMGARHTGLVHVAASGFHTWHDAAVRVFEAAAAGPLVSPCGTSEYPTPARRPANSRLDTSRAASLGVELPDWTASLDRWVSQALSQPLVERGTSPNG
jgi:dTDP-4-dehydrorhamnose reductase